jgi:hypothetical protein
MAPWLPSIPQNIHVALIRDPAHPVVKENKGYDRGLFAHGPIRRLEVIDFYMGMCGG